MRSLIILCFLIFGFSQVARANALQKVEIRPETVQVVDQRELGNSRFELTLEFEVATPGCIESFIGLAQEAENTFIPVANMGSECEKHLFAEKVQAKVEVGIYTKSLPARDIIKIGSKNVWLEEDFGQVSVIK